MNAAIEQQRPIRLGWIAALLVLAIGYRVFAAGSTDLANTSPLMAMCFGGGLLLGLRFCWIPALLIVASDLVLGWTNGIGPGSYTVLTAVSFTLAGFAGAWIGKKRGSWPVMWFGTMIGSIVFYLAANTWSWAGSPVYAQTLAGWWQSQTIGIPGFPPSLLFLRNALVGDTIWCLVAAPLFFWKPLAVPKMASAEMAG
ncbi:MAG: hypothetical protein HKN23_10515 [Verrucomicrobiales bacterium]|nr:hypothetical protein [Verrucomicrobiales bacterium]